MPKLKSDLKFKNYFLFIFLVGFSFFLVAPVSAAGLFFGTHTLSVDQGNIIEIGVLVNTQREMINALEANINFPEENLELKSIEDGNSIVSLWLKRPQNLENNKIFFSGIIPGGFSGEQGYLFTLIFVAKKSGDIIITSSDDKILLNDGQGTPTTIMKSSLALKVSTTSRLQQYIPLTDEESPEDFTPIISQTESIFNNQWFLVFDTKDKLSGIDSYQIAESRTYGMGNFNLNSLFKFLNLHQYQTVESPYLLKDQQLKSTIYLKVVDKSGNEKIVSVPAKYALKWYENYLIWSIIILLLILFFIVIYFLKIKKRFKILE